MFGPDDGCNYIVECKEKGETVWDLRQKYNLPRQVVIDTIKAFFEDVNKNIAMNPMLNAMLVQEKARLSHEEERAKLPKKCAEGYRHDAVHRCKNMSGYDVSKSLDYERYECTVCQEYYKLDPEEIK